MQLYIYTTYFFKYIFHFLSKNGKLIASGALLSVEFEKGFFFGDTFMPPREKKHKLSFSN